MKPISFAEFTISSLTHPTIYRLRINQLVVKSRGRTRRTSQFSEISSSIGIESWFRTNLQCLFNFILEKLGHILSSAQNGRVVISRILHLQSSDIEINQKVLRRCAPKSLKLKSSKQIISSICSRIKRACAHSRVRV